MQELLYNELLPSLARWPLAIPIKRRIDLIRLQARRHSPRHRRMMAFYSQFLAPGDLCFDIGANLGSRTAVFSDLGARVLAVEPQDFCIRHLRRAFGKTGRVEILCAAIGDHVGEAELAVCDWSPTASTLSERWQRESRFARSYTWKRVQKVPMVTLDTLIAQCGIPAFCKIDVEGYELEVLRGLSRPVPCISYEFQGEFLGEARACASHLSALGTATFNYSIGESLRLATAKWCSADNLFHALEVGGSDHLWGDIYVSYH